MSKGSADYVSPARAGAGLPVLLLHAWWGLNQSIKDLANRLAGDGFTVVAPDLFDGRVLTTVEDAEIHSQEMDQQSDRILDRVGGALDNLLARPDARGESAGIIALSFGAWSGAQVAAARPQVSAFVCLYGDVFEAPEGTVYLGHFAEDDRFVDSNSPELRAAIDRGQAQIYPGTQHWFIEGD